MATERFEVTNPEEELSPGQHVEITLLMKYSDTVPFNGDHGFDDRDGNFETYYFDKDLIKKIVAEKEVWEPQHLDVFRRWNYEGQGDDDGIYWIIKDGDPDQDQNVRLMAQMPGDDRLWSLSEMNFHKDELIYREDKNV